MRPFSLEEYLKNPERKVVTRDGRKVTRFLCTDAKADYPIVALVENFSGNERPISYTKNGEYMIGYKFNGDLFFVPEIHKGWINVYSGSYFSTSARIFSSEEDAKKEGEKWKDYVTTIKIEWET